MNIINSIRKGTSLVRHSISKHAPEILLGSGIIFSGAAIVTAVINTDNAKNSLDFGNARKASSMKALEDGKINESEYKHDAIQITVQTASNVIRDYMPTIALETVGVTCILVSHGIMKKRLTAMASAYAALNTAFANYRGRIRNLYGSEIDNYALTGARPAQIPAGTTVDGEKTQNSEKTNILDNIDKVSPYARYFTKESKQWKRDMDLNMMYLRGQERYLNQKLHIQGYIFLNEVYDALGMPPTPEGQVVGWWDDPVTGDGKVDLGLTSGVRAVTTPGLDGYEHAILINPNVDGPIYERLSTIKPELSEMITPGKELIEIGRVRPEGLELF